MRNRARVSRLFLPQQFSEVSTFCLIHKAVSRDYFYLCPGVITSRNWGGENWSRLHVHSASVFEALAPTLIVLTNAEGLGLRHPVTADLGPLAFLLFSPL